MKFNLSRLRRVKRREHETRWKIKFILSIHRRKKTRRKMKSPHYIGGEQGRELNSLSPYLGIIKFTLEIPGKREN